jgi:uracil-DNA glycosylase
MPARASRRIPASRSEAEPLDALLGEISACRVCAGVLPHPPRPVLRVSAEARILIAGQAPGRLVHETGLPFNDPSGQRLREWMGIDRETFYDQRNVAVAAMGFCFPGTVNGADLPPRKECAPLWRPRLMPLLTGLKLTLLVGGYAQSWHLREKASPTLTETVARWREFPGHLMPLPHPSWRNTGWLKRNPWFEAELVPVLRQRVKRALAT